MNEPLRASESVDDTSTRHRILAATAEVLARSGQTKLSFPRSRCRPACPDRRCTAGSPRRMSCSTRSAVTSATCSTPASARRRRVCAATEKLDAALQFIVDYQQSYSGVRLVDIEPEVVIAQLGRIIPVMRARLLEAAVRPQRRGQGRDRNPRRGLALHRSQRRRQPVPRAASPRGRDQAVRSSPIGQA